MRRFAIAAATLAAFGVFTGAGAANHSGPEDAAKGRGTMERTVVGVGFSSIFGFSCLPQTFVPIVIGEVCIAVVTTTDATFDFDAVLSSQEASTPLGEPHGHMKLSFLQSQHVQAFGSGGVPVGAPGPTTTTSFTATADVTCLTVVNNKATLSGRVTRFQGSVPPQRGLFFDVTDNTIARQQVAPDQFAGTLQPEALQVCPAPMSGSPITQGDILVEDN